MSALIYTLALFMVSFPTQTPADWQPVKEQDGITLWSRREDSSVLFEFRGRTLVAAPIMQVSAVVWDTQHKRDWLAESVESVVLERPKPNTALIYNRIKTPPIIADRDVVFESIVTVDYQATTVRFDFRDTVDARRPPRDGVARMAKLQGYFLLRKVDATHTEVTYQALVNPGGAIPLFIVNWVVGEVPVQTLRALRTEATLSESGKYDASAAEMQRLLDWHSF